MPPLSSFDKRCIALAIAQTFILHTSQAATIEVDSLVDDNGTGCTLREAIANTNAGTNQTNGCSIVDGVDALGTNDTINFDSSLTDGTITLNYNYGELNITDDVVINGLNNTIDANKASRVMYITGSTVSLNYLTIANGEDDGPGGGIFALSYSSVSLNSSTLSGNSANHGGGIYAEDGNSVSLSNSTLSGNSANHGGGIYAEDGSSISLSNSTLSGNSAGLGGGIYAGAGSSISLSNSTLSGNSASEGGGIYAGDSSSISLSNSIVSGNAATTQGAEIQNYDSTITAADKNNLFGHSGLTDSVAFYNFTPGASDVNATSDGDDNPTAISSILDTTLADNGGSTFTHALVADSPAIDAANDAVCAAALIYNLDQRGESRPVGAHCDIGSFESEFGVDDEGFIVIPLPGNKVVVIPSV